MEVTVEQLLLHMLVNRKVMTVGERKADIEVLKVELGALSMSVESPAQKLEKENSFKRHGRVEKYLKELKKLDDKAEFERVRRLSFEEQNLEVEAVG